jgi:hypothetical protein
MSEIEFWQEEVRKLLGERNRYRVALEHITDPEWDKRKCCLEAFDGENFSNHHEARAALAGNGPDGAQGEE